MFEQLTYRPYPQTAFALGETGLTVSSPWLSIDVDIDAERRAPMQSLIEHLERGQIDLGKGSEHQEFLQFFSGYPLLHVNPRKPVGVVASYESAAPELLAADGPRQFLHVINPFGDIDVESAFSYFPSAWGWDPAEILDASRIEGTELFDPMSVYTAIRSRRLDYQTTHAAQAHDLLARLTALKKNDEPAFFGALATLLAQQYYVTRECCSCLDPAIEQHTIIGDQIRAYKDEEIHHDRLILKSIRELSDRPTEEFFFAPEVRLEIEVIKYAAKTCALGFSALVSIMEGTVYPESDPVGDILRDSSKPGAHVGVEAHFQINRRGNHTAIPEQFVAELPPVTRQTVEIATRLSEVTICLDTGLARTMLQQLPA
jgi:hypothetical protein